jgi:hypothetical protein
VVPPPPQPAIVVPTPPPPRQQVVGGAPKAPLAVQATNIVRAPTNNPRGRGTYDDCIVLSSDDEHEKSSGFEENSCLWL